MLLGYYLILLIFKKNQCLKWSWELQKSFVAFKSKAKVLANEENVMQNCRTL